MAINKGTLSKQVNGQIEYIYPRSTSDLIKHGENSTVEATLNELSNDKVDKVSGKGLSANDFTNDLKTKLEGIATGANKTTVDSALSTSSTNPVQNKVINTALGNKVDKVTGKELSTNDFTDALKTKLEGVAEGATNVTVDAALDSESTNPVANNAINTALGNKVDKVSGKGLSANDFTNDLKTKLEGVATGATKTTVDSSLNSTSNNPVQNKVINTALGNKVDKVAGKGLSTNDFTDDLKTKLEGIATGANKTTVDSALSATSTNPVQNKAINTALSGKVDTVSGKGLSANDFTDALKTKLDGIAEGATNVTVDADLSSSSTNPVQNKTINTALGNKVDKVSGKGLSTNDFTSALKTKLEGIDTGANKTIVDTALDPDSANPVANSVINTALGNKVDVVSGKGLSANDFTNDLKTKLEGIAAGANKTTVDSALSSTSTNPVQNKVINSALAGKVDTVSGKGLSANDFTNDLKTKLEGIATGATKVTVDSALSATSTNPVQNKAINTALAGKVDTVSGKGLSTNDFTAAYKTKLDNALTTSDKGVANGVAPLNANTKIDSAYLPSYVDDVVEGYYASSKFYSDSNHTTEIAGETGKIYVNLSNNKTYRWSGSAFTEISASLTLGITSSTAYRGDYGNTAYTHSQTTSGNPHNVTKAEVGLGNVDNTADASKTVNKANTLVTPRTIDGVSFDGSANISHFGTCSTAAATAAKTVDCTGFTLAAGAEITVKFTVTNTATSPTLNVNGTGAKPIYYKNAAITKGYLAANRIYKFVYDGTNYVLIGDVDTNTTYSVATTTANGLMSSADKALVTNLLTNLNTVTPTISAATTNSSSPATVGTVNGYVLYNDTYIICSLDIVLAKNETGFTLNFGTLNNSHLIFAANDTATLVASGYSYFLINLALSNGEYQTVSAPCLWQAKSGGSNLLKITAPDGMYAGDIISIKFIKALAS